MEAYLRNSFYGDYADKDMLPIEHLSFHLGKANLTPAERFILKDLLGIKRTHRLPNFINVLLLIDLVIIFMD